MVIVSTMGLKPSPSGETFRTFLIWPETEAWKTVARDDLSVGLPSSRHEAGVPVTNVFCFPS